MMPSRQLGPSKVFKVTRLMFACRMSPSLLIQNQMIRLSLSRGYASKSFPDHTVIQMPALSPTMTQGNLAAWQKSVGDKIEAGDILAEIETDKAQMEFEMTDEGYLAKILVEAGAHEIPVGSPIAITVEDEADVASFKDFTLEDAGGAAVKAPEEPEAPVAVKEDQREASKTASAPLESESAPAQKIETADSVKPSNAAIIASPNARRIASEKGISLVTIKGTGPNGRIITADVEAAAASVAPKETQAPAAASVVQKSGETSTAVSYTDKPISNMRKTIASRLTESYNTAPHYFLTINANVEKLLQLREALNKRANGKYKISVNDMIVKASALALRRVPQVNSSWMNDFIRQYNDVDISMAVATPEGLITPIIRSADKLGLKDISNRSKDLAIRARENKLKPEEYQGGTFTISNLGMYDIDQFTAIINPPQSCILALGSTKATVIPDVSDPEDPKFKVARMMRITMSADHRVVDGAVGAQFTQELKNILEDPLEFFV